VRYGLHHLIRVNSSLKV